MSLAPGEVWGPQPEGHYAAQVAEIAARFEVASDDELLRNLVRVSAEYVRSRAVAIYRYDTFSEWTRVHAGEGSAGLGEGAGGEFPARFTDAELSPMERDALHEMLRTAGTRAAASSWVTGQVVRPDDIVVAIGGGEAGAFLGILVHRGVSFRETSPSVRAMLEALARWASLILRRPKAPGAGA
jgi:uncharacterized protein YidB (DUF937 family)